MDFLSKLKALGYNKSSFSRLVKVDPHTVGKWCNDPPEVAVLYVDLRLKIKELSE
jgi:hypothetical protein